ncbi:transcriptional regulator [Thermococcus profundus]|uniref:Transcriptional regulator n=1 Tax=Thermococcus profundus TaxID=49899 RepID=A0A2Z2MHC5_THEPR|nr:ArsR family transcriptional regulator [Thermococcus profundus]ASJ03344.1 transcriptional regulator [Thermococcus profundus]
MESDMGRLLDILGNETRRRILILLTRRPYYVSELSQELGVGQKAVLEHLKILKSAGLVEERTEKIPRGRPRKYYTIRRGFRLEVMLTPYVFGTELYEPRKIRAGEVYSEARELIKSTEPAEEKVRELVEFLGQIEERLREMLEAKRELEEVRLMVETYIENLLRRVAQENEELFDEIMREVSPKLPRRMIKSLNDF